MNLLRILFFPSLYSVISCVYIEKNGYKEITVSFSKGVLLDGAFDFLKLKDILTNASDILFHATKKRSFFEEFLLVVPSTWSEDNVCEDEFVNKGPRNIDIYVTESSDISDITARHSKKCREKGEIIYLSKDWTKGNLQDLALQFVQQWSIFRYGVFPENPESPGSCIASTDSTWSPTGCYNIDLEDTEVQFDEKGIPLCYFPDDFGENEGLHSSIMFSAVNSSKMLNFCDGSQNFPHNPIAPTLHNRICGGDSVWSEIEKTDDFKFGRNLPVRDANLPRKPIFRCFKESKTHLTLMIQDTDSEARSEIRYALLYFLSIIEPEDFAVSLGTFSSSGSTNDSDFKDIDLKEKKNLKSLLESRVKLNEKVSDVCLTCGLRKAYNKISQTKQYSLHTIVLISRESSLKNAKISEITDSLQKDASTKLHLLFLEDTVDDIVPSSLVEAVQNNGGRIFRLKNDPVSMLTELTTALLDASKNILHAEDDILVVNKKIYVNVTSDFTDSFLTPKNTKGKLFYSMQFKKRGDIKSVDEKCDDMDIDLQSPICGSETNLSGEKEARIWEYPFRYAAGSEGTICSSLALLKLDSTSRNSLTVKGWLSENKINPGENALIIYAEVYNRLGHDVNVEAKISGPGLEDFRLQLRDNGNGDPDIIKGDNIYSRYFTSFNEKGTYTVSIVVEVLEKEIDSVLTKENSTKSEMKVSQTKVIGTFRVIQAPPTEDILPPNRVCDLKIISISNANRTVSIQWTAPGDDYDYGKAKNYIIKLSNNWMAMTESTFDLKENIQLDTKSYQPADSGIIETLTVQCPPSHSNETYYMALQAIDNNYNAGRVSNIIQIHFKDAYIPTTDKETISTETSKSTSLTTLSSDFTTNSVENIASTDFETTSDGNTDVENVNQTKDGIFIEKKIFIISISSLGVFILFIIILNIIIYCCCCKKQHTEKPKELSIKESLRPPHNLNIAYKHDSETSLNEEQLVSNSSLIDRSTINSSSDDRESSEKRYSYHTDRSLRNKMESHSKKNDLGFKLVKSMPAYATSSLSRFATSDTDNSMPRTRSNIVHLENLNNNDAHVYPLGQV